MYNNGMDGNQKMPASPSDRQSDGQKTTAYNPPSLVEPLVNVSQSPQHLETPASQATPGVSAQVGVEHDVQTDVTRMAADMSEPGFYNPGGQEESSLSPSASPELRERAPEQVVDWASGGDHFQTHAGNWRLRMSLIGVGGAALVFILTRSFFSAGAILVAGVLFAILGSRQPKPVRYRLDAAGIIINRRRFIYGEFRSFWISETTPTINLVPLKRFAPITVLRYDPQVVNDIVNVLSKHLPMQAPRTDAVDGLLNRLKV